MPSAVNKMKSFCVSVTHTIPTIVNKRCCKRQESRKKGISRLERNEHVSKIKNTKYVSSWHNTGRSASRRDETLVIETINIHNLTVDKNKNAQFLNEILDKELMIEGLLEDVPDKCKKTRHNEKDTPKEAAIKVMRQESTTKEKSQENTVTNEETHKISLNKRLNCESTKSCAQSVKNLNGRKNVKEVKSAMTAEKRKMDQSSKEEVKSPPFKKQRIPIVFDADKKEKKVAQVRKRTESESSDVDLIVTTAANSHKYYALPSLSQSERKPAWCRAFPLCRYGAACAFQHPRCKFAAACTRRGCAYSHALPPAAASHAPTPAISSHVVPAANFKSVSASPLPIKCKYYPLCSNPVCSFFHPKACRYGAACLNKLECNFYHADLPSKWRYPA